MKCSKAGTVPLVLGRVLESRGKVAAGEKLKRPVWATAVGGGVEGSAPNQTNLVAVTGAKRIRNDKLGGMKKWLPVSKVSCGLAVLLSTPNINTRKLHENLGDEIK